MDRSGVWVWGGGGRVRRRSVIRDVTFLIHGDAHGYLSSLRVAVPSQAGSPEVQRYINLDAVTAIDCSLDESGGTVLFHCKDLKLPDGQPMKFSGSFAPVVIKWIEDHCLTSTNTG